MISTKDNAIYQETPTNQGAGVKATATLSLSTKPTAGASITLNGTVFTYVVTPATANEVAIGANATASVTNLIAKALPAEATYLQSNTTLTITYGTVGVIGNSYTISSTYQAGLPATLTGGLDVETDWLATKTTANVVLDQLSVEDGTTVDQLVTTELTTQGNYYVLQTANEPTGIKVLAGAVTGTGPYTMDISLEANTAAPYNAFIDKDIEVESGLESSSGRLTFEDIYITKETASSTTYVGADDTSEISTIAIDAGDTVLINSTPVLLTSATNEPVVGNLSESLEETGVSGSVIIPYDGHIHVAIAGGGGGGGGANSGAPYYGGSGGGGSALAVTMNIPVTAGQSIPFTIGSGGSGGASNANGAAGSASSILTLTASGGGGGGAMGGAGGAGRNGGGVGGKGTTNSTVNQGAAGTGFQFSPLGVSIVGAASTSTSQGRSYGRGGNGGLGGKQNGSVSGTSGSFGGGGGGARGDFTGRGGAGGAGYIYIAMVRPKIKYTLGFDPVVGEPTTCVIPKRSQVETEESFVMSGTTKVITYSKMDTRVGRSFQRQITALKAGTEVLEPLQTTMEKGN